VDITAADGTVRSLTTRAIVIAAGAGPALPPVPGIDTVDALTSDTVWGLRALPGRLLVLGGGPIGCELGQAFARLGSQVTLVEAADRLLAREDDDVGAAVAQALAADGVDLRLAHTAVRFERLGDAKQLVASQAGSDVAIPFDTLLVATGRAARLQGYGLEELGIATGRTVQVDGYLQTSIPTIYAAGDVAGPWQFTHAAAHQAWHAAVNALFAPFKRFRVDGRCLPAVTFTAPEVARVGLNRRDAAAQGVAVEATRFGLDDLDRAIVEGAAHGWVEVLTPPGSDRILGATVVGDQAGELLATWVLAMKHGIGLNKLLGTVHAYPTLSEANKAVAGHWKRAHAPQRLLAWVERFHAWRRG
jgi:pyruvate/2-oxoglutarate dehydrogenase complex dihydrolipoamide dehydrogenase (E3) component